MNYNCKKMPANLAGRSEFEITQYKQQFALIAELRRRPLLTTEELRELAMRIRPLYKFNEDVMYWLTPAGTIFPDSFGSRPVMRDDSMPFLGIPEKAMHEVATFVCYAMEPWKKLAFNIAEIFRQLPSNIQLASGECGAFRLLSDGFYDTVLQLYCVPIVFYRLDCSIPQEIMQYDPLPPKTDWQLLQ